MNTSLLMFMSGFLIRRVHSAIVNTVLSTKSSITSRIKFESNMLFDGVGRRRRRRSGGRRSGGGRRVGGGKEFSEFVTESRRDLIGRRKNDIKLNKKGTRKSGIRTTRHTLIRHNMEATGRNDSIRIGLDGENAAIQMCENNFVSTDSFSQRNGALDQQIVIVALKQTSLFGHLFQMNDHISRRSIGYLMPFSMHHYFLRTHCSPRHASLQLDLFGRQLLPVTHFAAESFVDDGSFAVAFRTFCAVLLDHAWAYLSCYHTHALSAATGTGLYCAFLRAASSRTAHAAFSAFEGDLLLFSGVYFRQLHCQTVLQIPSFRSLWCASSAHSASAK